MNGTLARLLFCQNGEKLSHFVEYDGARGSDWRQLGGNQTDIAYVISHLTNRKTVCEGVVHDARRDP